MVPKYERIMHFKIKRRVTRDILTMNWNKQSNYAHLVILIGIPAGVTFDFVTALLPPT